MTSATASTDAERRDATWPWLEHLRELRRRVLLAVAGLVLGAVPGWIAYPWVFQTLQEPIIRIAAARGTLVTLNFSGLSASLDMQVKAAFFLGVLLSAPWWIYQVWAFIAPGLTRRERRNAIIVSATGVPLFLAGAALAWVVLPEAVAVLTGFTPAGAANVIDAQTYLTFIMRLVLAFGLAFLVPLVMVGLNLVGLLTARQLLRGWRWATLLAFVFSAIATPTGDALTMSALAVPIMALYFSAVGVAEVFDRRAKKREHSLS